MSCTLSSNYIYIVIFTVMYIAMSLYCDCLTSVCNSAFNSAFLAMSRVARQGVKFSRFRHCILLCKAAYRQKTLTTEQSLAEPSVFSSHTNIHHAPLLCDRYAVMGCSVSALLTSPLQMLPPGRCQFCLWVKHLNIRWDILRVTRVFLSIGFLLEQCFFMKCLPFENSGLLLPLCRNTVFW